MKSFEIFIIKTLPDEYVETLISCLNSERLINIDIPVPKIIEELSTREHTLNKILSLRHTGKDLLIIADDIILTEGWFESLKANYSYGDIIGFSMIDANSGLLQNYGYDFISLDGQLSYKGKFNGDNPSKLDSKEYRECHAVTGCTMYIKNHVLNEVKKFPIEGANRWGEIIFCHLAYQKRFKTIVLPAALKHYAISTKQKKSIKKSSLSWIIEKDQWSNVQSKFLQNVVPLKSISSYMDSKLELKLKSYKKGLIYGCGVNANFILQRLGLNHWDVCSGLKEEIGCIFNDKEVLDIKNILLNSYQAILITPIGYDSDILQFFEKSSESDLFGLDIVSIEDKIVYKERPLIFPKN